MKGYGLMVFSPYALALHAWAEEAVRNLPEPSHTPGKESFLRCHEIARAFAHVMELPFEDGHYCAVEHSWLYVKHPKEAYAECILDVYAVGRLPMVQLVDVKTASLSHYKLYREGKKRTDIRERDVEKVLAALSTKALELNYVRYKFGLIDFKQLCDCGMDAVIKR